MSCSPVTLAEPVQKFMQSTLKHYVMKRKRCEIGSVYPRPDMVVAKVLKLDPDVGALADDLKKGDDNRSMKIQVTVLVSSSPLANFLSHLTEQGVKAKKTST